MNQAITQTIGVDLGDKQCAYCVLDEKSGDVVKRGRIRTAQRQLERFFAERPASRVVMEVGTHSPWISRLAQVFCAEVHVANARDLRFIHKNPRKSDDVDAEALARVGRMDVRLLNPIQHRSACAQRDLVVIRLRAALVEARTKLVNSLRGLLKSYGERLPKGEPASLGYQTLERIPEALRERVKPYLLTLESMSDGIREYDEEIETLAREKYPETRALRRVPGVGTLTALTFVLTLEDRDRFPKSRSVGAFLGMVPRRDQSGEVDKELRITKAGDPYLRALLVQGAQCILRKKSRDSDLKRFGERLAKGGGKIAKRKAVVAVARKLAVVLNTLWRTGEIYEFNHCGQAA